MNWIKTNPFVSVLTAITVVICAALAFFGLKARSKFSEELAEYQASYDSVRKSERIPLYPKVENKNAKTKSLGEYEESITDLKTLFDGYRPEDMEAMPTQRFTAKLKATVREVTKAFEDNGAEVPDDFFLGFERYQNTMAVEPATPILNYQMEGVKNALLKLAEAKPDVLIKVYRDPLIEETGGIYEPGKDNVSRGLGYEITFKGSEDSARKFLTSLGKTEPYYYVVRCIKLENESLEPPRVSDAEFQKPKEEAADPVVDNSFGSNFAFPDADTGGEDSDDPAGEETPEEPAPKEAGEVDTTRILAQVLGSEDVIMFVRLDLSLFFSADSMAKP